MLASLCASITSNASSEHEKVQAIFSWITSNISYKKPYRAYHFDRRFREWEDSQEVWYSGDEMTALKVLYARESFCEGFAKLFKVLCNYAGIRSEVVNGYARGDNRGRFSSNHSWNAVMIDSSWHLLDATWASGYVLQHNNEFIKQYDPRYFLASPASFLNDHYPENIKWTLLKEIPPMWEYRRMPFHYSNYVKYNLKGYSPSSGIVAARVGDTVRFEVKRGDARRDSVIGTNYVPDSSIYHLQQSVYLHPEATSDSLLIYRLVVPDGAIFVHLMFRGELLLRYRLKAEKSAQVHIYQ